MLDQARMADQLGYASVSIPEHHLLNVLLMPAPLLMAVRISSETKNVRIMTSIAVLPLHDMRTYAGEVVMADILTNRRLILGVGRGAFAYEMARLGTPIETSKEKFDESLDVLQALLTEEEVSWDGDYYKFEALTVMPRPVRAISMMMAVMAPPAIYACTKRGFSYSDHAVDGVKRKNAGTGQFISSCQRGDGRRRRAPDIVLISRHVARKGRGRQKGQDRVGE